MVDEVAGPEATEKGATGEDDQIQRLASPASGERSWETIARKRELIALLEAAVKRDTPQAIKDARAAEISMPDLARMWNVTAAWIYTISPARPRKRAAGK